MSENETTIICIEAGLIYRSFSYNIVLLILIFVNTFAIFFVLKSGLLLYKAKSFHFNLRWLILNIAIAILIRTLLTTTRAITRITHAFIENNECNFLSSAWRCTAESTLQSLPLEVVAYTFPFICFERFMATLLNEKYEKFKSVLIVLFAIAATWLYPSYTATMKIISVDSDRFYPYCSTLTEISSVNFGLFMSFYFQFPLFCFIICTMLYFYCKYKKGTFLRKRSANHSLTARYQLTEIIQTTRYVVPICLSFCLLFFFQLLLLASSVQTFNVKTLKDFSVIKEISSLLMAPIFANFFGFLFYLRHRLLKCRHYQTIFGLHRATPIRPIPNEMDAYFRIYESDWK